MVVNNMDSLSIVKKALQGIKDDVAPKFTKSLTGDLKEQAILRLHRVLDYTIHGGKMARSCLVLDTFRALKPDADEKEIANAARVSTVMEILQAFFLIIDDVMDNGEVRRGKPCWHRLPNIGLVAINDGLMLDQMVDLIVRDTLKDHPRIHECLREIQETKRKTVLGELFDTTSKTIEECTFDRYDQIIAHKTTFYTYLLPIQLGFHLAARSGVEELFDIVKRLGLLFSALDDYLDVFGDPALTGKTIMNDLVEGKCTWITCTALIKLREPENTKLLTEFEKCFGTSDRDKLNRALEILKTLKIDQQFEKYEEEDQENLRESINRISIKELQPVLLNAVEFIVRLSKKMRKQ